MRTPTTGWSNQHGMGLHACSYANWKQQWIRKEHKPWPSTCSVKGCKNPATAGAHVRHPEIHGGAVVPVCEACLRRGGLFTLKEGITVSGVIECETDPS